MKNFEEQPPAPDTKRETAAPRAPELDDASWADSPETLAAKDSVHRAARGTLPPEQVDALVATLDVPSPAELIAREGGAELGAEVAATDDNEALRRRAIGDAYQAVMAGAALAGGQPRAAAAVAAASPELRAAATNLAAQPSGGTPLPEPVRAKMEQRFGEDFSGVQIHTGSADVATLGAGAATLGEHVRIASAAFDPYSREGEKLLAHELTHVVQQRGASASGAPGVAASAAPAEHEAEAAAERVANGEAATVTRGSAAADLVHLGEAGVHRGIELEAAGVGEKFNPKNLTPQQKAALEMYAGNFMRDYSQLAAPGPLKMLSRLPSSNKKGTIGNAGARTLIDAIVQSIAILELGKDIGKNLVTPSRVGVYEAEQHLDNPIGTSGANDFITEGAEPKAATSARATAIRTFDARGKATVAPNSTTDEATARTHAGSAVPGLQYENPELYKVGEGGLANHLANSTEHAKDLFLSSVQLGATPEGRMRAGMGQHIVEDYFSHSNFIEVGLNTYINEALRARRTGKGRKGTPNDFVDEFGGRDGAVKDGAAIGGAEQRGVHAELAFVDTLYDQKTKSGKQAVTTGTFGGTDSQVSLGHVLVPKLPVIERAMHKGVDSTFGIIEAQAKEKKKPTWQVIKTALDEQGNEGAVASTMLEASRSIGLAVPCPSGFHLTMGAIDVPMLGKFPAPNGIALDYTNVPIADALVAGATTYVDVMERLDQMERAAGITALKDVIHKTREMVRVALQKLFAAVRAKISELLRQVVIEMYNIDPKQAAHANIDELTKVAEKQMHDKTDRTSMQSRLQDGGNLHGLTVSQDKKRELETRVGPVRARDESQPRETWGTTANPWVTVMPLPPSHSEISKDHPPHAHEGDKPEWHDHAAHEEHDDEHEDLDEGSSFYGLHRALAVEADRHIQKQLERCWRADLIPGQPRDHDRTTVGHDALLGEASQVSGWTADQRGRAGIRHAQTDKDVSAELRGRPEVMDLLNLVDTFVSHPSSSTWWRTVFDRYLQTHGEEVHKAILSRNKTRGRRRPPKGN